jgi:hypothetical protein
VIFIGHILKLKTMRIKLNALSLFLAPLLYALSGFFWQSDGQYTQYTITSGTLLILGSIFWVFTFYILFDNLKEKMPYYSSWGLLIAVYGCLCGGVAFALRDIYTIVFHIPHQAMLDAFAQHPVFTNIVFWIGGPAFPVSLLILGIMLIRTKTTAIWAGICISLAGILFPVSRIIRIGLLAHVTDLLMLIPLAYLGWQMLRSGRFKAA